MVLAGLEQNPIYPGYIVSNQKFMPTTGAIAMAAPRQARKTLELNDKLKPIVSGGGL